MTNFLVENNMVAYQYKISYKGKYSYMDFTGVDSSELGVCHADELFVMFQPHKWVSNIKFIYSEKAKKFCEIFTLLLTGTP